MGTRPHLLFCAFKTAWLASESLVSMGPIPYLWFLHTKQRLLDQNNKSLCIPDLICHFVHAKHHDNTRNTSFYESKPWSAVLCIQKSDFRTRIACLYGSQTSPVFVCMQQSVPSIRITNLYGSQPSSVVLCMQNSDFRSRHTSLYGSQTSPVVLCMQNSAICTRNTSPCRSKTSPSILCMQIGVPSIRNTSLYGSQPSSGVFGCKTATFRPEQQVSMGSRFHLSFCAWKTVWLAQ